MSTQRNRGSQTVDRAVAVLRALASAGSAGIRLTDLQSVTGLSKQTVHRVLTSLIRHGFAEQGSSRAYRVGPEIGRLAWSTVGYEQHLRQLCQPELEALAEKTGDTVFLMIRSGMDTVCIDLKTGNFPIKAMPVEIGTRRPLGIGASGIILLAFMDGDEAEQSMAYVRHSLRQWRRTTWRTLGQALRAARSNGYAFSEGLVTEGINGLAVAVTDNEGRAIAALSLAAIQARMKADRVSALVGLLRQSKRTIERKLRSFA